MDAVVQLLRNALCCVKDLNLLSSTILYDPKYTAKFYKFPEPHLNQTTPLEVFISISQLYACVSCALSGYKLIKNNGLLKLKRLGRVADNLKDKYRSIKTPKVAMIIQNSIMKEANSAFRDTLVGFCVMSIGISFFWLFANSLHITAAGWIGGLPALIHALTVMEIVSVPLLYWMIKDAAKLIKQSIKIEAFVAKYNNTTSDDKKKEDHDWLNLETFSLLQDNGWTPFWAVSAASAVDEMAEEKLIVKEVEGIERKVKILTDNKSKVVSDVAADRLLSTAKKTKLEGYREYLYFLLNFIAFYGYLLGVVVYYFDKDDDQHFFVTSLKFGSTNEMADWSGNFAGDLMWTIEPIVILSSPFALNYMTKSSANVKVKSD